MKTLATAAIVWPLALAATIWARQGGEVPVWTMAIYAIGARICHQLPDRSFFTGGVQWPVCARCAGLYASAPIGGLVALFGRRRPGLARASSWLLLVLAALPTAITLLIEWSGLGRPSNLTRFIAAVPLGAAIAFLLVRVAGTPANDAGSGGPTGAQESIR